MKKDGVFVSGIARSKESGILGVEKLSRMIDANTAEEAFRLLREYGFGKNAETDSYTEYEKAIAEENAALHAFIREYSPSASFTAYCFLKDDFHNAEVAVRSVFLGKEGVYKEDGLTKKSDILAAAAGDAKKVPHYLAAPMKSAYESFNTGKATGAGIADIFIKGYYAAALKLFKGDFLSFTVREIDCKNVSLAVRTDSEEIFRSQFIRGGKISAEKLLPIVGRDYEKAERDFAFTENQELISLALKEAGQGKPLVMFERAAESYPLKKLSEKKYEPTGIVPLAMYYLYKVNEMKNVRIIMVGKLSGTGKEEIKARLKENYVG